MDEIVRSQLFNVGGHPTQKAIACAHYRKRPGGQKQPPGTLHTAVMLGFKPLLGL